MCTWSVGDVMSEGFVNSATNSSATSLYDVVPFLRTFSHTFIEKCRRPFPTFSVFLRLLWKTQNAMSVFFTKIQCNVYYIHPHTHTHTHTYQRLISLKGLTTQAWSHSPFPGVYVTRCDPRWEKCNSLVDLMAEHAELLASVMHSTPINCAINFNTEHDKNKH